MWSKHRKTDDQGILTSVRDLLHNRRLKHNLSSKTNTMFPANKTVSYSAVKVLTDYVSDSSSEVDTSNLPSEKEKDVCTCESFCTSNGTASSSCSSTAPSVVEKKSTPKESFECLSDYLLEISDVYYKNSRERVYGNIEIKILALKYNLVSEIIRRSKLDYSGYSKAQLMCIKKMTSVIAESILYFFKNEKKEEIKNINEALSSDEKNTNLLDFIDITYERYFPIETKKIISKKISEYNRHILCIKIFANVITFKNYDALSVDAKMLFETFFENEQGRNPVKKSDRNNSLILFLKKRSEKLHEQGRVDISNLISLCVQALKYCPRITSLKMFNEQIAPNRRRLLGSYVKYFLNTSVKASLKRQLEIYKKDKSEKNLTEVGLCLVADNASVYKRYSNLNCAPNFNPTKYLSSISANKVGNIGNNFFFAEAQENRGDIISSLHRKNCAKDDIENDYVLLKFSTPEHPKYYSILVLF